MVLAFITAGWNRPAAAVYHFTLDASSGAVAQLGERRVRNAKVGSSILLGSTNRFRHLSEGLPGPSRPPRPPSPREPGTATCIVAPVRPASPHREITTDGIRFRRLGTSLGTGRRRLPASSLAAAAGLVHDVLLVLDHRPESNGDVTAGRPLLPSRLRRSVPEGGATVRPVAVGRSGVDPRWRFADALQEEVDEDPDLRRQHVRLRIDPRGPRPRDPAERARVSRRQSLDECSRWSSSRSLPPPERPRGPVSSLGSQQPIDWLARNGDGWMDYPRNNAR